MESVTGRKPRVLGIVHFAHSPSLNDHPNFIRPLREIPEIPETQYSIITLS
jgi:hypothetical protein